MVKAKLMSEYTGAELQEESNRNAMESGNTYADYEVRKVPVPDMPDGLNEDAVLHFLYLRACYSLQVKPSGCFEDDAAICAAVIAEGGTPVDMYHRGCDPLYAALLSNPQGESEVLRKIIDQHIPF
jgi:hypothetical protein